MNSVLIGVIIMLALAIIIMVAKWPKYIEISDVAPEEDSPRNRWLKLQNEGGKYVQLEEGKVKLKVVK